jgi:hypothetical protein
MDLHKIIAPKDIVAGVARRNILGVCMNQFFLGVTLKEYFRT